MGTKDILVVSAHAADYCTRAGGTLAKYAREGYNIHIIAMSFGARGESGDYWKNNPGGTVEDCSMVRERESANAAHFLGATIEFWGLIDYPLTMEEEHQRRLTRKILDMKPALMFTHWTNDPTNEDHAETGKLVIRALASASQIGAFPNTPAYHYPDLYFFEPTVPFSELNGFAPDFYVNIDETYETKLQAIAKFECQPFLKDYYIHFAAHRAFQARTWTKMNVSHAEGFKRFVPYVGKMLPVTDYSG